MFKVWDMEFRFFLGDEYKEVEEAVLRLYGETNNENIKNFLTRYECITIHDDVEYEEMEWNFEDGTLTKTGWEKYWWFQRGYFLNNHFVHVSDSNPEMVAFYASKEHLMKGRITTMKPGKYLQAYYGTDIDSDYITKVVDLYKEDHVNPPECLIAMTPEEIVKVYNTESTFTSCMYSRPRITDHDESAWDTEYSWPSKLHVHPTYVYGAGDLGVAYLKQGERIVARAVVWPEKKMVGQIYGRQDALRPALKKLGYTEFGGIFDGARILKIPFDIADIQDHDYNIFDSRLTKMPDTQGYVMPYIDNADMLEDAGDHWIIRGMIDDSEVHSPHSAGGVCFTKFNCCICGERGHAYYTVTTVVDNKTEVLAYCHKCGDAQCFYSSVQDTYCDAAFFTPVNVRMQSWNNQYYNSTAGIPTVEGLEGPDIYKASWDDQYYWGTSRKFTTADGVTMPREQIGENTFVSEVDQLTYSNKVKSGDTNMTVEQALAKQKGDNLFFLKVA